MCVIVTDLPVVNPLVVLVLALFSRLHLVDLVSTNTLMLMP